MKLVKNFLSLTLSVATLVGMPLAAEARSVHDINATGKLELSKMRSGKYWLSCTANYSPQSLSSVLQSTNVAITDQPLAPQETVGNEIPNPIGADGKLTKTAEVSDLISRCGNMLGNITNTYYEKEMTSRDGSKHLIRVSTASPSGPVHFTDQTTGETKTFDLGGGAVTTPTTGIPAGSTTDSVNTGSTGTQTPPSAPKKRYVPNMTLAVAGMFSGNGEEDAAFSFDCRLTAEDEKLPLPQGPAITTLSTQATAEDLSKYHSTNNHFRGVVLPEWVEKRRELPGYTEKLSGGVDVRYAWNKQKKRVDRVATYKEELYYSDRTSVLVFLEGVIKGSAPGGGTVSEASGSLQQADYAALEKDAVLRCNRILRAKAECELGGEFVPSGVVDIASTGDRQEKPVLGALAESIDFSQEGMTPVDLSEINSESCGHESATIASGNCLKDLDTGKVYSATLSQEILTNWNMRFGGMSHPNNDPANIVKNYYITAQRGVYEDGTENVYFKGFDICKQAEKTTIKNNEKEPIYRSKLYTNKASGIHYCQSSTKNKMLGYVKEEVANNPNADGTCTIEYESCNIKAQIISCNE